MSETEELREALVDAMAVMPAAECARLSLDVCGGLVDRRSAITPVGADLISVTNGDGTVTVVIARGRVAGMLRVSHGALKDALGVRGGSDGDH